MKLYSNSDSVKYITYNIWIIMDLYFLDRGGALRGGQHILCFCNTWASQLPARNLQPWAQQKTHPFCKNPPMTSHDVRPRNLILASRVEKGGKVLDSVGELRSCECHNLAGTSYIEYIKSSKNKTPISLQTGDLNQGLRLEWRYSSVLKL